MTVWIIYSKLDENYGAPFKVFNEEPFGREFCEKYKDAWGLDYCCEELEVEP